MEISIKDCSCDDLDKIINIEDLFLENIKINKKIVQRYY